jgi:hypothetical protein
MVVVVNVVMFLGIFSRMIPFQALSHRCRRQNQRGSYNAVSASIQQLSGGLASVVAGHIVSGRRRQAAKLRHVGYVVVGTSLLATALLWRLQRDMASSVPASSQAAS